MFIHKSIHCLVFITLLLVLSACTHQKEFHSVIHVSRWIADDGECQFRVYYDDATFDTVVMRERDIKNFEVDQKYHRSMNEALWDQAWAETEGMTDRWQSFKDRYVELGGTMLFD